MTAQHLAPRPTRDWPPLSLDAARHLKPRFDYWPMALVRSAGLFIAESPDLGLIGVSVQRQGNQLAAAERRAGSALNWYAITDSDLAEWLAQLELTMAATGADDEAPTAFAAGDEVGVEELSLESLADTATPVVRAVHAALYDALRGGASDVHFEATPNGLQVKVRLDGVLIPSAAFDGVNQAQQMLSRLKVMAELDIAERRVPQDGRFRLRALGRVVDFRISVMPSAHGEDAVVRILDKQQLIQAHQQLTLGALGFAPAIIEQLRFLGEQPYGMVLVTGPTGSGKTTTLYALLSEINRGDEKIVTIEDPIEYQVPGVLQIPVNEKKGLSFARGLRSILRHDPDRIMIGEIRDTETAEIAVQSALTGHMVLTTVHANNIFDVVGRFLHMRIDINNFVDALNGVMAQRLLRLNCSACTRADRPDEALLRRSRLNADDLYGYRFMRGIGCAVCRGTGYKGRRAIAELLLLDDELRELIRARAPVARLKALALARGTRLLRDVALAAVAQGETTLDEINRVTLAG